MKLLPLLTLLGFATPVYSATLLYSTDFNAPTYADAALAGQDGWVATATATPVVNITSTATNGVVALGNTGQDVNHSLGSSGSAGSTFYVGATINLSAAQATGDYFMHLGDGGTSAFFGRVYAKSTVGGYVLAFVSSSGTPAAGAYGTAVLETGTAYNILFRYDYVAGVLNDTGSLWVNPLNAEGVGDTPYVGLTILGADPTVALSTINLRQGNSGNAPTLTLDNLSASGTLIPEPTTALLGALGFLAILRRRR